MAQNKKTQCIDPVKDQELPTIPENHIQFARLIAEGKTATDAYRTAVSKTVKDNTLWTNASRLKNDAKVALWIDAFKREVFNSEAYTLEAHIEELNEAIQLCKANGNLGAMVTALQAKGKVRGHYVDRYEDVSSQGIEHLLSQIQTALGPEIAQELADNMGLDMETTDKPVH